jgi:Zn-dependent peptidase ImmA (M78 family)/O-acetyl-ADP-ribose deacetylase (regulator of RNase III)
MATTNWSNPSVLDLAGKSDPIETITNRARQLVLEAIENGWEGPPFDPLWLAEYLGIQVVPLEDVVDARAVPLAEGRIQIEYNPNQARSRVRFSLAHEIAHSLFPDCSKTVRNRLVGVQRREDEWQLELLCNIAAAEFLMPTGTRVDVGNISVAIDEILRLKEVFAVSTEAMLLRVIRLTNQPVLAFAASRTRDREDSPFRIEYAFSSRTSSITVPFGMRVSSNSILSECTAVGYTAKGRERWSAGLPEFYVECVGVSPYPNSLSPRILGIARVGRDANAPIRSIKYIQGDATEPRGKGLRIIAHIVNDKSLIWGAGFAKALRKKWSQGQQDFRKWALAHRERLGKVQYSEIGENLIAFQMVAQHGYGRSIGPRIRYSALNACLTQLGSFALERKATVHMPLIGTGEAGGDWAVIEELITENLVKRGVDVTVYKLPKSSSAASLQHTLPATSLPVAQ